MEEEIPKKKKSGVKRFFKTLALASIIVAGYGLLFSQCDAPLTKGLSKKTEFVAGVDFEAYNKIERLGVHIVKKGATVKEGEDLSKKEIENWLYISAYEIGKWPENTYSNVVTFIPYYGDLGKKDGLEKLLEKGDTDIGDIVQWTKSQANLVIRIKGDKEAYKDINETDVLDFITERVAKSIARYESGIIVEFEAPKNNDVEAHKKRIELIRKYNPKIKIATSVDKSKGYDESLGRWDPEKSRKYWETSDIVILEDYFSKPEGLKKSIKEFKDSSKKPLWVRIVVGTKRLKERKMDSLEEGLAEYESLMRTVYDHADGCLADDTNGVWLYSSQAYDDKERQKLTKQLYKEFRGVKFIQTRTQYGYY